ncbi:MAG TPA: hypothetical protein DDZ67_05325 [Xanthomonadaceae bacterium]|nr:hypothetical protein [Xanthomonadaceae bacterium]
MLTDSPDRNHFRQQCEQLGTSRVRGLLLDPTRTGTPWRREAQAWLDERLRDEGRLAFRLVVAAIAVLAAVITGLALYYQA